jgi:16S rRNA (guanine527-N7)-methyltransferase
VKQRLAADARRLGLSLDDRAIDRLASFLGLLERRAIPLGLVGESERSRLYERHLLDCLRALAVLRPSDRRLIDMGSGAGLPGIVMACARPNLDVVLVDSRRRAGAFLEAAVDLLRLGAEVRIERLEAVEDKADVCTARALAPLPTAWELAHRLLRPSGRLVYFAGVGLRDPEAAAEAPTVPCPPAGVQVRRVIASSSPLIMMVRGPDPC